MKEDKGHIQGQSAYTYLCNLCFDKVFINIMHVRESLAVMKTHYREIHICMMCTQLSALCLTSD